MNIAPKLSTFQSQFGHYLRSQTHGEADDDLVPKRVGTLYQSLIFNSVMNFPQQCFPICQALLKEKFDTLCQKFFAQYTLHSPYFTDINRDFVDFIGRECEQTDLPDFFADLAHFEWVELAVDILPDDELRALFTLNHQKIALNSTLQNLCYNYPVHQIDTETESDDIAEQETFLLMYRDAKHDIAVTEVNALTYLLLDFMMHTDYCYTSITALLAEFLPSVGIEATDQMVNFAIELIDDLLSQQVFIEV